MPNDHLFSRVLHKRRKECKEQSSLSPYPLSKREGSDYFQEIKRKGVASSMEMKRRSHVKDMEFYMYRILFLLVAEVGGNLAPFLGFPFDDGDGGGMGGEPSLGAGYEFVGFGSGVVA